MPALPKEMVPGLLATGASARLPDAVAPRFRAGDAVIARNVNPLGHTRVPRYIKGKRGVVHLDHGVFAFPDAAAGGLGHVPQHVYSVRFMARELWGELASPLDSIHIDLFDEYMDLDPAASAAAPSRPLGSRASSPRRSARPERSGGARKPRKARRPGVRVQKAAAKSPVETPARASRKSAAAKKRMKTKASKKPVPGKRRAAPAKPARAARKKARVAR